MKVAILTVSDRCSNGLAEDTSGPGLEQMIPAMFPAEHVAVVRKCVPDALDAIQQVLEHWSDVDNVNLILTTGGTGCSPRDVTPEATLKVIERKTPGLIHQMTSMSLTVTPLAMLSRSVAGIRGNTLIINLPGSQKGSSECLKFIASALPHAIHLITNKDNEVKQTHEVLQQGECHHHRQELLSSSSKVDASKVALRDRNSPFPMISVAEAQRIVFENCEEFLQQETKNFEEALGRILAEDVYAQDPLPPFPASVKDGYAVVAADGAGTRPVVAASFAGLDEALHLMPGQCVRINTGAPVPTGADAVVQVEDTELVKSTPDGKEELEIRILKAPVIQQDIRKIGSDLARGSLVLKKFTRLGAAELGLLATVGAVSVQVFKEAKISLLSTGNELQDPNTTKLKEGTIRDSNKSTLKAMLKQNHLTSFDCGIAIDVPDILASKIRQGLSNGDVLVTTGGVSMGDRDILRQVLVQDFGAHIHFARVNMKPGKPTTFATLHYENKKKLVLGLPGNPVSALVTSHLYLLPICRKIMGDRNPKPAIVRAKLSFPVKRLDIRPEYRRVILKWNRGSSVALAEDTGNQMSCRLSSCSEANGLILLPGRSDEVSSLDINTELDAMIIGDLRDF